MGLGLRSCSVGKDDCEVFPASECLKTSIKRSLPGLILTVGAQEPVSVFRAPEQGSGEVVVHARA